MTRHRRSFLTLGLAIVASLFCLTFASAAEPLDFGYRYSVVQPIDHGLPPVPVISGDQAAALIHDEQLREMLLLTRAEPGGTTVLKPEYRESYETNGLNFIDIRLRC